MFVRRMPTCEAAFALIIMGAFLYGTYEMNRGGQRAVEFGNLRERILKHVDANPNKPEFTLNDLQNAGVVSEADVEFMKSNGITYKAVGAASPKDTVCFVHLRDTAETRYYKDRQTEYRRTWLAPDKVHAIVKAPKARGVREETISIVEQATGKIVHSWDLGESSANDVFWSSDSRFGAVTVHRHSKNPYVHYIECGVLFEMTPQGVRRIDVPAELGPDHLLPPKHAGKPVHFNDHWVMAKGWQGHELSLESQGIGRIKGGGADPDHSFNLIYRFSLRVADGKASITRKSQKHYAETAMK